MSGTLEKVKRLAGAKDVVVSRHGFAKIRKRGIALLEIVESVGGAVVLEDYPNDFKGPSVLTLQRDGAGAALHAVWGIARGTSAPAVLITAYRPDPLEWNKEFTVRRIP